MNFELLTHYEGLQLSHVSRCLLLSEYNANQESVRDEITHGICILKFQNEESPLVIDVLSERREITISSKGRPCGQYSFYKDVSTNSFWRQRLKVISHFSYLMEGQRVYGIGLNFISAEQGFIFYDDGSDSCRVGSLKDIDSNHIKHTNPL